MGKVIEFPNKTMTIDDLLVDLAQRIAAANDAVGADATFLEAEAKELRDRYFSRPKYEFTIDIPGAAQHADEIHKSVTDALESVRDDCIEDKLRMAAEIMTLKLTLRS